MNNKQTQRDEEMATAIAKDKAVSPHDETEQCTLRGKWREEDKAEAKAAKAAKLVNDRLELAAETNDSDVVAAIRADLSMGDRTGTSHYDAVMCARRRASDASPSSRKTKDKAKQRSSPPSLDTKAWQEQIFYDREHKTYLIPDANGDWFQTTEGSFRRQCRIKGISSKTGEMEAHSQFDEFVVHLQNYCGVSYSGPLAGSKKGPRIVNGSQILVTRSPELIRPVAGDWLVLRALVEGMFFDAEYDQLIYFYGWMQCALHTLHSGIRKPGQLLVLAGPRESGKSLLQSIITWTLGGREAKPHSYMTGSTDFNSELFGAEHLRLDDEQASTDIRARRAFGARIKEMLFGHDQRVHGKNRDALSLDPIWRGTHSLNDEPENLMVLPLLDESMLDKLTMLRINKVAMPMPTGTNEQTKAFADKLKSELPAFVYWLLNEFTIPENLRNERCGISHWHHPELLRALRELSPEARLLSFIDREIFSAQNVTPNWSGTADQLENELTKSASSVASEAKRLFTWPNACGTFLGKLAHEHPDRVKPARTNSARRWNIYPISDFSEV